MPAHTLHAVDELAKQNESFYHDDLTGYANIRFRILGINPGNFNEPIVCRLRSLPIRQDLAYGALSYAWGSHQGDEEIILNGQPGFKITKSVAGAIRRLRHHDRVRCLWVDAICVNQANTRERSQQVALMADIFRFAELVYVWLGGCSGTVVEGGSEIEQCDKHEIEWDGSFKLTAAGQKTNDPFCEVQAGKAQWWWRTWAVQEIALGRKIAVILGPHQLSWSKAKEALEHCWLRSPWTNDVDRERFREAFQQLDQLDTVRGKRAWICNYLRYLLQLTASHAASDERDKIYGVLGLLETNKSSSIQLVPDYSKPYEEVCKDATLHLIEAEESLDVLLEDWRGLEQEPFWALDFAGSRRHPKSLLQRGEVNYLDAPRSTGNELMCCASKDSKASFRLEGQHLSVYGIHFDTIETIVRFDEQDLGHFTIEPVTFMENGNFDQLVENGRRLGSLGEAKDPWAALQSLELLAKHLHPSPIDVANVNLPLRVLDISEQFARTITGDRYAEAFRLQMATSQLYREYAWATLRGRAFFLTEQGFCGVGTPEVEVGDSVAVLFGASMPAVVRSHAIGEWKLIGECYISGIMYGELMDSFDVETDVQEFKLI